MHAECPVVSLLRMDDLMRAFLSEHDVRKMDHKKPLAKSAEAQKSSFKGPQRNG